MEKKKKTLVLSILAIATLLIVVVGATYAYFVAQGGSSANTNVNVQTNTTDNLSFEVGEAINITANQDNFAQGLGNQAGSTTASATLTANNATNSATRNYYLYLNITSNDFEYTVDTNTPELILTIENPDGTELQTLGSYTYTTVGDGYNQVTGFDITTANGLITLADNYEISATEQPTTQEWHVTVTFINLDSDQEGNTNKIFSAELIIQEETLAYHDVCTPGTMACDIARLYIIDGTNELYYHDGSGTYGVQEAGDNSYRYAGANPNNYVCFGSDEETCPEDNLYRIIGVFDGEVKLIKSDYANSNLLGIIGDYNGNYGSLGSDYKGSLSAVDGYYWNNVNGSNSTNDWSTSRLNTVNLNTNYINSIGSEWQNLIAEATWQVGGMSWPNGGTSNAQTSYNFEVGSNKANITYEAKIGLMYLSDYYYGANPAYWNYNGNNSDEASDYRAAVNDNWMYMGLYEWTISRGSDTTSNVFGVHNTGSVGSRYVYNYSLAVRPVFYLNSNVQIYEGHAGTQSDPYRIVL